VPSSFRAAVVI
jgi:hypothetical protein